MLQGILNSRRLKWNLIWFVVRGLYVAFPSESGKILGYVIDHSLYLYDTIVATIGADAVGWIKTIGTVCLVGVGLYFGWKWFRLELFRYKVQCGKIQPIIADGVIQELKMDEYDDGYRSKGHNYTPNYTRSCKVQWVVPGFGEMKEESFSFNLLQTFLPSQDIVIGSDKVDMSDISSEGPAMKFILQYIKIGNKLPVVIDPNNIHLYYADDPLLQYKLKPLQKNSVGNTANPKIVSGVIKRFVIPMAILIPTTIVILFLISTQL